MDCKDISIIQVNQGTWGLLINHYEAIVLRQGKGKSSNYILQYITCFCSKNLHRDFRIRNFTICAQRRGIGIKIDVVSHPEFLSLIHPDIWCFKTRHETKDKIFLEVMPHQYSNIGFIRYDNRFLTPVPI
ncbi:unnamed protein product [Moneuplotes crassus]|uniref:Uncharacterized protein n=1 Tax=Euplotes crassus TaxID=5936 RepID=A0AAD1XS64_EUPCR|nr:unnamed protein product [Moneuplotes crassus]